MDGDRQDAEGLTEEKARQALERIFTLVERRRNEFEDRTVFRVLPRSSLFGDNRTSRPYQVAHAAVAAIGTAYEHLHAVRALLVDARIFHPAAPFTLTRAAIEAGATTVWMLSAPQRRERALRRLRLAWQDAIDSDRAAGEIGARAGTPLEERKRKLTDIARTAARDPDLMLRSPTTTEIVTAADDAMSPDTHLLTAWRICAGFSHGRLWTTLSVLDREEELGSGEPDVAHLRVTGSLPRLFWAVSRAWDVSERGWDLYSKRRMPP